MEKIQQWIIFAVGSVILAIIVFFSAKYVLCILAPFIVSYLLSCLVRPLSAIICSKTHLSQKAVSFVLMLLITGVVLVGCYWLVIMLVKQSTGLVARFAQLLAQEDSFVNKIINSVSKSFKKLNFDFDVKSALMSALSQAVGKASSALAGWLGMVIRGAPSKIFAFAVGLISLFYFAMDGNRVNAYFKKYISKSIKERIVDWSKILKIALVRFSKAYLLIFVITFGEVLAGLWILGVDFALPVALVIAFVDILPVLGVGTVLIPWAVFSFAAGNVPRAVGLLVLFAVIYAIRQIAEPKIVGKGVGVHPLVALVAAYAGFCIAGVSGLILSPAVLYILSTWFEIKSQEKSEKTDLKS